MEGKEAEMTASSRGDRDKPGAAQGRTGESPKSELVRRQALFDHRYHPVSPNGRHSGDLAKGGH